METTFPFPLSLLKEDHCYTHFLMSALFFSHDRAHNETVWIWDRCAHVPHASSAVPLLLHWQCLSKEHKAGKLCKADPYSASLTATNNRTPTPAQAQGGKVPHQTCIKGDWRVLQWQRGLRSPAKPPPSLHQHILAMQKPTQLRDGAGSQERLTLYKWENSISKGVRRDRGNGFTVTEMTLEFRTVLFLGRRREKKML